MRRKVLVLLVSACFVMGAMSTAWATNLVANGNFDNGLAGWSLSSSEFTGVNFLESAPGGNIPAVTNMVYFGRIGDVSILSQTLSTVGGSDYTLSFYHGASATHQGHYFGVMWNSDTILTIPGVASGAYSPWQIYSLTVHGTGSDVLAFVGRNDPAYDYLAKVSVSPTPIPAALWLLGSGVAGLAALRRKFVG